MQSLLASVPTSHRSKNMRRREWLTIAAGATLVGCTPTDEQGEVETSPETTDSLEGRFIDAHVHVWTPDLSSYPISSRFKESDMRPPSFTPDELFAQCRPAGVDRINLIQMSFYQDDHRYMLDAMSRYPETFAGTGLLTDVTSADARPSERMVELADQGLRAFRIVGRSRDAGPAWMEHANYAALYRSAAERRLILSFLLNPPELPEVGRMCMEFPDTPVIIDHLGRVRPGGENAQQDTDALLALAAHPNVYIKIGAFYALSADGPPYFDLLPLIEQVVSAFGPERCMWESDCPYQVQDQHSYAASVALIRDHAEFLTAEAKRRVLTGTAEELFFS